MPDTFTDDLGLVKPGIGESEDTWGEKTNDNWDRLDTFAIEIQAALEAYKDQWVGSLAQFPVEAVPEGWLACDGAEYEEGEYPKLFARIGRKFGGEPETLETPGTFRVPEYRGEWVRNSDFGRGIAGQVDRPLDEFQDSQNLSHNHGGEVAEGGEHSHAASSGSAGSHSHSGSTNSSGNHRHNLERAAFLSTGPSGTMGDSSTADDSTIRWISMPGFRTSAAGNHSHSLSVNSGGAHTHQINVDEGGAHVHNIADDGGDEVRVRGYHALMCIKT